MHGSHKLWITIAVFLVVIGLLLGMYFTATPDKVGSVVKNKKSDKMQKFSDRKKAAAPAANEVITPQTMEIETEKVPDELQALDLESIKAEHASGGESQMPDPEK